MNIHLKMIASKLIGSVLLCVFLVLSIVVTTIGYFVQHSAAAQLELIEKQYTTIAVPSGSNQSKIQDDFYASAIGEDSFLFSDGTQYIGPIDAENTARLSEYYIGSDHRILLSAHVAGAKNLSSGTVDYMKYNAALDKYCYQLSVMALRCIRVEERSDGLYKSYSAEFEIIDAVSQINAYDLPPYDDTLLTYSYLFTSEGEIPFEIGKNYLVRGIYQDYEVRELPFYDDSNNVEWRLTRDEEGNFNPRWLWIDPNVLPMEPLFSETGIVSGLPNWIWEKKVDPDSNQYYYCTPEENCWPYYAEHTGDWKAFLETEEGLIWKNEIIPNFEMNHASVPVILTDNLESMYGFNVGNASILEGTSFSQSDYEKGENVCLVSASYAKINDLTIGDIINLDYFQTEYEQTSYSMLTGSGKNGLTVTRWPLTADARINVQKEYTIIGIYTAPEWEQGAHSFHADTIFVPKASVPSADNYAGDSLSMLNTVLIENGFIDKFEAHMEAYDMGGAYIYFDQGYGEVAATIQTMIESAMQVMRVGIAMFMLASILFLLLYIRRATPNMRIMRVLGISKTHVCQECFRVLLIQEMVSVILGNLLAFFIYDYIAKQILTEVANMPIGNIAICGIVQLVLLASVGRIWIGCVANRNILQKG